MKAAFRTEGKTTTQSALSSKSWGMSSGTSRISFNTVPLFFSRSSSFSWSAAQAGAEKTGRARNNRLIRQVNVFFMFFLLVLFQMTQIRLFETETLNKLHPAGAAWPTFLVMLFSDRLSFEI